MFPKSVPHPRLRRAKPPREMPRCWTEDEDENGEGEVKKRAAKRAKNKDADDITSRWTWKRFGQLTSHDSAVRHSATVIIKLPRCEKVFCEKWIHEDTCALTQMGCKYSHPTKVSPVTPITHQPHHPSPPPHPQFLHRYHREKIFCDKWIHEGTCAFTQMGASIVKRFP